MGRATCDSTRTMSTTILHEKHDDGRVRIDFRLIRFPDESHRAIVVVTGQGTMDGAHAMVDFLDKAVAAAGDSGASALMRLDGVESTPLRAQFLLTKWLLQHKSKVARVSVVGAKAWERKLATAVCTVANFKAIAFHQTEPEARSWLGWKD